MDDVVAQVQINGIDRSFENGVTVTIDGLQFGTKAVPSPKVWDDLSSSAYSGYAHGDIFPTRDGDNNHPQDSNAPQNRADYSSTVTPSILDTDNVRVPGRPVYGLNNYKGSALIALGDVGGDYLIVDWWIYSTDIRSRYVPPSASAIKLGRFWAGSSGLAGRITIYPSRIKWDAYPD